MKKLLLPLVLCLLSTAVWAQEPTTEPDCQKISDRVLKEVKADKPKVLTIVDTEVRAVKDYPKCVCSIVKAAIVGSKANNELVGQIVYTAAFAAPKCKLVVEHCALAVAPDAKDEVQKAIAKFDEDKGHSASSKEGGKNPKGSIVDPKQMGLVPGPTPANSNVGNALMPPMVYPFSITPRIPGGGTTCAGSGSEGATRF